MVEIKENLEKHLTKFDRIVENKVSKDSLKTEQDSLAENKEANKKASRANKISFMALGLAILSIVITVILYFA
ncbi:MAG: hypothetical protein ACTSPM_06405 [Candidatus Heimdallarchaeota archaeon]